MPILSDYEASRQAFTGRHWETGTIHNAFAYQGIKAPHTGEPVSEALLLGISGGITFGYFTFEYAGYLPHLVLLTRNTFDPMQRLLERLSVPQDILQTANPEKGEANLIDALEGGKPALVWVDIFSLPYYDLPYDERNWAMMPVLVCGYEDGEATIVDRSSRPLKVPADVLQAARGRVKKDKYRVVTLDAPDWRRLPTVVSQGIYQCVSLFTEAPPKGKRDNFGFAALQHWANMLTNTRNKQSWARYFEPGERMWMALVGDTTQPGAYGFIRRDAGNSAERGMYADFLNEAAVILEKPALNEAATQFRQSEAAWGELAELLLPDEAPMLREAKTLLNRKHDLFIEQGMGGLSAIQQINVRLRELQKDAAGSFPLTGPERIAFCERLAEQVLKIHDLERDAVKCMEQ